MESVRTGVAQVVEDGDAQPGRKAGDDDQAAEGIRVEGHLNLLSGRQRRVEALASRVALRAGQERDRGLPRWDGQRTRAEASPKGGRRIRSRRMEQLPGLP
ncbi:hypothetical protein D3C85_1466270 [compost metagenome]